MTWPFGSLKLFGYGVISADPNWQFRNWSEKGEKKNPNQHYRCDSVEEIAKLPVNHLAAPDCVLQMWATAPMIREALWLMSEWGFKFKTMGAWAKQSSTGKSWQFGPGYVLRSAMEPYLIGTRGNPKRLSASIRNLIVAPVREHSRKPDQMLADLEQLFAGPYCELFSRSTRAGWDCWGDEAGKFD